MSRRRRLLFVLLSVSISLGLALVVGEMVLRFQTASVRASDRMDPGLLRYDPTLGWTLQPRWKGRHVHHDFDVEYVVSPQGVRGPWPRGREGERVVLVGDSFTFGLGVDEDATFARRLESLETAAGRQVVNFGIPGYSTDQEALFFERNVAGLRPDAVVLVVCLINDVFDNERVFPLQAMQAKPRFRLDEQGALVLENIPVPRETKSGRDMQADLASLVMGEAPEQRGRLPQWLGGHELTRRLGLFQPSFDPEPGFFEGRFADSLDLFYALVERVRQKARSEGASFYLAVLPGRSAVEDPAGFSAQYQDFLREAILAWAKGQGIAGIDLASSLRRAQETGEGPFFHPNEGHLNAEGHRRVALGLDEALRDRAGGGTK